MYVIQPNTDKFEQTVDDSAIDYREELPNRAYEIDVLSQFKANMAQLEDLQMRLKFVLNEVSTLIKKR